TNISNEDLYNELENNIYQSLDDKSKGYTVRFPVVEINGDLYYNIGDHNKFANAIVEFYENN
ncbi:MAG: hypothetical protein R6V32_11125, partial [Bacteroidales bacterium]